MKRSGRTWAVVAGGGTGGHVIPGLAIAEEIVARCDRIDAVHYLGSRRGLETRIVPEAGFSLTALPGRGIARKPTLRNLGAVLGLGAAILIAVVRMAQWRPAVVVGLGGFASVPGVVAAVVWRIPLVVAEQNAVPSAANRLGARFAKVAAVPFPEVDLPNAVWTGNPVRAAVTRVDRSAGREEARQRLAIDPERRLVCVFGGSLGARRINEAVLEALEEWRDRDDLTIRHITGERDYGELTERLNALGGRHGHRLILQQVEFEHDMAAVYAASDLVVCRAGAGTVAELTVAGVPAILIPFPGAAADHQNANAAILSQSGAVRVVPDSELNGERLSREVDELLGDEQGLRSMSAAAKTHGRPDAAEAVVDLLERYARRPLSGPLSDDPAERGNGT